MATTAMGSRSRASREAQVDGTVGPFDMRAQFTTSSPANPRSVFDKDQYANWAGGAGYTIRQGFRVGVSAYRGPYLDRHYQYYFPGEAPPRDLPATGYGLDVQWGRGPWNVYGELSHFQFAYKAIPTFNMHTGYAEVRRVLTPRWYVAARTGYERPAKVSRVRILRNGRWFSSRCEPGAKARLHNGALFRRSAGARHHDSVRHQLQGVRVRRTLNPSRSIPPASSNFRHAAGQVNRSLVERPARVTQSRT